MILMAVVGFGFVVGMPYLLDSSTLFSTPPPPIGLITNPNPPTVDPEMKKEFEEQQKNSMLSGGGGAANPLQNFDMAAWMAGKTTVTVGSSSGRDQAAEAPETKQRSRKRG